MRLILSKIPDELFETLEVESHGWDDQFFCRVRGRLEHVFVCFPQSGAAQDSITVFSL